MITISKVAHAGQALGYYAEKDDYYAALAARDQARETTSANEKQSDAGREVRALHSKRTRS